MSAWSPALYLPDPADPGARRFTLEEWSELLEDVPGELVDGYLTEEEMPDPVHGLAASWLIAALRGWLRGRGGFVFDADVKLALREGHGRKADVTVYLPGRPAPPRRGALHEPPDIAVEIVSPTPRDERRDRVEKMEEYAAFGVPYYWLVDPALGSFEIFALSDEKRYTRILAATAGLIEQVPGCAGLALDLDELWADLAGLAPE